MEDFGEILKALRLSKGFTQQQLADRLGICKTSVSYYEQSRRLPPSELLIDLSRVFHVSVDYLLGLEQKKRTLEVSDLPKKDIAFLGYTIDFLRDKNDHNDEDDKKDEDNENNNQKNTV